MVRLEFRTFLLQISKKITRSQFESLKFVLKGIVSPDICDEIKEVCHYLGELERRRFLSPTNFGILKKGFCAIGRLDLVELLEEKEQYYADFFRPQLIEDVDTLEQKVPTEILARGPLALQAYTAALSERRTYNRVPVMLIGQPGVGKTSLVKSLKGQVFNPHEDSTEGIDVNSLLVKVTAEIWKPRERDEEAGSDTATSCEYPAAQHIYVDLWDFGGKDIYYATHPIFLTPRAVYLLTYDLRWKPFDKANPLMKQGVLGIERENESLKTNWDYLDFWMNSVASLVSEREDYLLHSSCKSDLLPEKLPPVFLVCTHADELHSAGDSDVLAREIFDLLQSKPYSANLFQHVFVVDNTKSASESECAEVMLLRKEILAVAKDLPQMKETIPLKWLKYEKALQVMKKEGHKKVTLKEAKEMASEVCKIDQQQEILTLLNYLHDQRVIIHFADTPELNDLVVLDPKWLIDVFKRVITVKPSIHLACEEREFEDLWVKLETTGILEEKLLNHVWASLFCHKETSESITAVMRKFCLLCPLQSIDSLCSKQYLVTSMLMANPPNPIFDMVASTEIPSLFLKFESGHVPAGLFARLVMKFYEWCTKEFPSQVAPQFFHNFARFYIFPDEGCSLVLLCHSSSVEVIVLGGKFLQSDINLSADFFCDNPDLTVARVVRSQLPLMVNYMQNEFFWLKNMRCEVSFLCPVCCERGTVKYCQQHNTKGCKQEECLHFLSESELKRSREIFLCPSSATALDNRILVKQFTPWFAFVDEKQKQARNECGGNRLLSVEETVPRGTLCEERKSPGYGTLTSESTKDPTEGEYSSTTFLTEDIIPDGRSDPGDHSLVDSYLANIDDTENSEKKAKSTNSPDAAASKKKEFTGQDASAYTGHSFGYGATPVGPVAPQQSMPIATQMEMLQQFLALQQLYLNPCSGGGPDTAGPFGSAVPSGHPSMHSSSETPRADLPAQLRSYDKGGYSVVIINGTLCQSGEEKGVVMMESGTQFKIALANNNDCAAEVDITFGGMFLGVWLVEAKRSFSSPLIIEGSSWAKGRLTFFSTTDPRRLNYDESCFGQQPEFNGVIELEFKPVVLMLKLVVKHVWKDPQRRKEIFMPDFKTATVGDLKQEICKKYRPGVSCLIMSGKVLEEDKSMSSYALESTEAIEVLHIREDLSIESPGRDPVNMKVDPFKVSVKEVKNYIEEEMNIDVNDQHLRHNGQNIDEIDRLCDIFITAKKKPVIRVDKDRDIKIKVHSHSGGQQEVQINWFATVNDLKKKLEQQGISIDTLKFKDAEISTEGRKQLIDLGFKPADAVITVHSQKRSTHIGFSASTYEGGSPTRGFSSGTRKEGFGDFGLSSTANYRGHPSGFSTLHSGPGDTQSDSAGSGGLDQEGVAMLYGNEESVYRQFREDQQERRFSKERAVTLKIQIIAKSGGATALPSSSTPLEGHYPSEAKGPKSAPYPPPIPDFKN